MANLIESAAWEAGIYQLETSDPVLAGPDGVDNLQAKQLANRTAFLKKQIDDAVSGALTMMAANRLKTPRSIAMTGDGSWTVTFDGNGNVSAALTLSNSGVVAGTWPMTTVDAKGRVTAGRALAAADIPALDFSKITSGKPTTLAGYGITDALPKDSPIATGTPKVPLAPDGTNTDQTASTMFVQNAVGGYLAKAVTGGTITLTDAEASNPVMAFTGVLTSHLIVVVPVVVKRLWAVCNATSGAFTLTVKTASGAGVAVAQGKRNLVYTDGVNVYDGMTDFDSIELTGVATAPTAANGTNSAQIATTAFVQQARAADLATVAPLMDGVATAGAGTRLARENHVHPTDTSRAPLASPAFTGTPSAPTAAAGTNTTQLANTAFVQAAVANLVASSPATLDTLNELAAALGDDPNFATTMTNALAAKAPLASPALTGAPTAPTPAPAVSQQVANMEAVLRSMGSYRGYRNLTANAVLTAADAGFYLGISAAGLSVTLPAVAGLPVGSTFTFGANGAFTIVAAVGSTISSPAGPGLTSAVMAGFCSLVWRGDFWQVVMGGDRAGTNFMLLPAGNMIQWGQGTAKANDANNADPTIGGLQISFPMAFQTGPLSIVCTHIGADASYAIITRRWSATSFYAETAGALDAQFSWIAIGR